METWSDQRQWPAECNDDVRAAAQNPSPGALSSAAVRVLAPLSHNIAHRATTAILRSSGACLATARRVSRPVNCSRCSFVSSIASSTNEAATMMAASLPGPKRRALLLRRTERCQESCRGSNQPSIIRGPGRLDLQNSRWESMQHMLRLRAVSGELWPSFAFGIAQLSWLKPWASTKVTAEHNIRTIHA